MINDEYCQPQYIDQQQTAQAHQRVSRDYLPGRIQHLRSTQGEAPSLVSNPGMGWPQSHYLRGHVVELIYLHGYFQTTLRLAGATYPDALRFWHWYRQAPPAEVMRRGLPMFERNGVLRGAYVTTPYLRYAITYSSAERGASA